MQRACWRDTTTVGRAYCVKIVVVAAVLCSITGTVISKNSKQDSDNFTTPSYNKSDLAVSILYSQLSEHRLSTDGTYPKQSTENKNSTIKRFSTWNSSTTSSYSEDGSTRDEADNDNDGIISSVDYLVRSNNSLTTSITENLTEIATESNDLSTEETSADQGTIADISTFGARNDVTSYDSLRQINYGTTQHSFDETTQSSSRKVDHKSAPSSTHNAIQNVQKIANELNLVQHYTEFIRTNWIAEKQRHHAVDHHLNLIPIEDGPFGSLIWRDKKYLISVLIPIGVGIAGAVFIVVMAYAVRYCHRGEHTLSNSPIHIPQVSMKSTPRTDQVILLADSSDDEF